MTQAFYTEDAEAFAREAMKKLGIGKESVVLNLACEEKRVPDALKGIVRSENVYGVDIDEDVIAKDPKIVFANVDTDSLPFKKGMFDVVVSVWGMEHFQTPSIFHEVERVLKPGGRFIFLTPNLVNPIFFGAKLLGVSFADFYYQRILKLPYHPHATYYRFNRAGSVKSVVRSAKGLRIEGVSFLGPAQALWYARFSKLVQNVMRVVDRVCTVPVLRHFKPYLFVSILKKS